MRAVSGVINIFCVDPLFGGFKTSVSCKTSIQSARSCDCRTICCNNTDARNNSNSKQQQFSNKSVFAFADRVHSDDLPDSSSHLSSKQQQQQQQRQPQQQQQQSKANQRNVTKPGQSGSQATHCMCLYICLFVVVLCRYLKNKEYSGQLKHTKHSVRFCVNLCIDGDTICLPNKQ